MKRQTLLVLAQSNSNAHYFVGMDKILQSMGRGNAVTVTNDGATILKSVYVDNPAAKVLVDISKVRKAT